MSDRDGLDPDYERMRESFNHLKEEVERGRVAFQRLQEADHYLRLYGGEWTGWSRALTPDQIEAFLTGEIAAPWDAA